MHTFRIFQIYEVEAETRYQAIELFRGVSLEDREKLLVDQFAANPKPQGWVTSLKRQLGW